MSQLLALDGGAIAGIVIGLIFLAAVVAFFVLVPIKYLFISITSGAFVNPFKLMAMRFQKVDIKPIFDAYVMAKKGKIDVKFDSLQAHFLAGGSCHAVISAMIKAKEAGVNLTYSEACSIDLNTKDVIGVVESAVTPKVLSVSAKSTTKDNFELEVEAKISVKARLGNFVGKPGVETIQAKVERFLSTKITALENHKAANLNEMSQGAMDVNMDKDSAYQLLSVDVVSVKVLQDVGAMLATQELERIRLQSQIDADRQKNLAIIQEQQKRIKTQEMKTEVLQAEAEVPKAIAEAIRDGRFSVMDYYKLMNLQADTAMRRAVTGTDEDK